MTRLARSVIGWEAVLPAGLWILGGKATLGTARMVMQTHVAPRRVTFRLLRISNRLSRIGFGVWRARHGKWR
jgi:hypothetical protein